MDQNISHHRANWQTKLLTYLALWSPVAAFSGLGLVPKTADGAENNTVREKAVVNFGEESWTVVKKALDQKADVTKINNWNSLWNNIEAVLQVSDNTAVAGMDKLRLEILERGATDARIPARIVHSALYTASVLGQQLNQDTGGSEEGRKVTNERLSLYARAAIPYLGSAIVDTARSDGTLQRNLVAPEAAGLLARNFKIASFYDDNNFHQLAAHVLGQLNDPSTMENAANELLVSRGDPRRAQTFLEVFQNIDNPEKVPSAVKSLCKELVFGRAELQTPKFPASAPTTQPTPSTQPSATSQSVFSQLDSQLTTPRLPTISTKSAEEQEALAKNLLLLAKAGDDVALSGVAQWFAQKPVSDGALVKKEYPAADYLAVQALSICAQRDAKAKEILLKVGASLPDLVLGDVIMVGSVTTEAGPLRQANLELQKVLSQDVEGARVWLKNLAERKGSLVWSDPVAEDDVKANIATRELARKTALRIMALMDTSGQFESTLQSVASNPFAQNLETTVAIVGQALNRDPQSLEKLFERAMDPRVNVDVRRLALEAIVYMDSPSVVPDAVRTKEKAPFTPTALRYFYGFDRMQDKDTRLACLQSLKGGELVDPFHARMQTLYRSWKALQEGVRANGDSPSELEMVTASFSLLEREFGGSTGVLSERAKDPEFKAKYLESMCTYLKNCDDPKNRANMSLAIPMLMVLGKAGYQEAGSLMVNMATYPERYTLDDNASGFFGMMINGAQTLNLRAIALRSMGGCVNLANTDDETAQTLFRVARKDSSPIFRECALYSLRTLSKRLDASARSAKDSDELQKIQSVRSAFGKQALALLEYHRKGVESGTQSRMGLMASDFQLARLADSFGMTNELLRMVDRSVGSDLQKLKDGQTSDADPDMRSRFARSALQALIANGYSAESLKNSELSESEKFRMGEMLSFVKNQDYWLGTDRTLTGKGREAAVFDVGYVLPLEVCGDLASRVIFPENLIDWSEVARGQELHPTMVAFAIHQAAREANIRTYNVNASLPELPFRPTTLQEPIFRAFEDLAELEIQGKANVDVANYSFGWMNIVLNDKQRREEFVDLMSAYMEVLSRLDVKHTIAAGNSQGQPPHMARFGGLGEVNSLGLRVNADGTFTQPDGIFLASAHDEWTGKLAEFSSKQDELRENEAVHLRSFHGMQVMLPELIDGIYGLEPGSGTSFAAPHHAAMILWGSEALQNSNLQALSLKDWQDLFNRSIKPLPGRESFEGGECFSVKAFLYELSKLTGKPKLESRPLIAGW